MPKTDLCLMLHPPSAKAPSAKRGDALQERLIPDVPISLARRIAEDFVRRRNGPSADSSVDRYTLYRIDDPEGERLLPVDFGEVASILYEG